MKDEGRSGTRGESIPLPLWDVTSSRPTAVNSVAVTLRVCQNSQRHITLLLRPVPLQSAVPRARWRHVACLRADRTEETHLRNKGFRSCPHKAVIAGRDREGTPLCGRLEGALTLPLWLSGPELSDLAFRCLAASNPQLSISPCHSLAPREVPVTAANGLSAGAKVPTWFCRLRIHIASRHPRQLPWEDRLHWQRGQRACIPLGK